MAELSLALFVEKTEVVRGESIRFVATLTNRGKETETLPTMAPINRVLTVTMTDEEGKELAGDGLSLAERTGGTIPPNRTPPQVDLAPGKSQKETGDALAWIGELPPGKYRMKAWYEASRLAWAESKETAVTVAPAGPAPAAVARPGQMLARAPRLTVWLNRRGAACDLFVLRTHPNVPAVAVSCRPVATLSSEEEVLPSSGNGHPPAATHLVWIEGGRVLRSVRLPPDAPPESPVEVPLPVGGLRPLGMPFTDREGGLAVVLATADGARAMLVKLPAGGKASATQINPAPPIGAAGTVFWSREERLFLLWTGPDAREVFGAVTEVAKPASPLEGKRVFTAPRPVADLRVYQRYDERRDRHDVLCLTLCHDWVTDLFLRLRVNLANAAVESREEFLADGMGDLEVLQSELDGDHHAAYLFRDPDGKVWYGPGDLSQTRPIEVEPEKPGLAPAVPLTTAMSPTLVAAGRFSPAPGFYLRFIRDGERFEVRRL